MQTSWALLIGVGVNVDRRKLGNSADYTDTSLPGAVPDIDAAEACLNAAVEGVRIKRLTVSKAASYNVSGQCAESDATLPTQANVINALKEIIQNGRPGEHVYIHFSGHGTRLNVEQTATQAVALVLFDPGELGASYLHGERLRRAVEIMIEKGLFVTVVLDCCFSGSVLRHDLPNATVRFMSYDDAVDVASNNVPLFESQKELRSAIMKSSHLLDPDKYIVLSACSPGQSAREGLVEGGIRRGALSYFLYNSIAALRKRGARIRHQSLHQHICASFRARSSMQSPMMLGHSQESFWKHLDPQLTMPMISVFRELSSNRLILDAGQAHGVHPGDEYAVYAHHTMEMGKTQSKTDVTVQVVKVNSLTSEVKTPESAAANFTDRETTWEARLMSSHAAQKIQVVMTDSVTLCDVIGDPVLHHPYMNLVRKSAEKSDAMAYQVVQDEDMNYIIQDASSRAVPGLPLISSRSQGAQKLLLEVLGHMASYRYFETIENPSPDPGFEQQFSVDWDVPSTGVNGYITARHGSDIEFTFTNLGSSTKYLSIFLLKSTWDIENLTFNQGNYHWIEVAGKSKFPIPLTMELSDENSLFEEDTFRFIITSKPTVFSSRVLPPILKKDLRERDDQVALTIGLLESMSKGTFRNGGQDNWSMRTALVRTVPCK